MLFIAVVIAFGLSSCGGEKKNTTTEAEKKEETKPDNQKSTGNTTMEQKNVDNTNNVQTDGSSAGTSYSDISDIEPVRPGFFYNNRQGWNCGTSAYHISKGINASFLMRNKEGNEVPVVIYHVIRTGETNWTLCVGKAELNEVMNSYQIGMNDLILKTNLTRSPKPWAGIPDKVYEQDGEYRIDVEGIADKGSGYVMFCFELGKNSDLYFPHEYLRRHPGVMVIPYYPKNPTDPDFVQITPVPYSEGEAMVLGKPKTAGNKDTK